MSRVTVVRQYAYVGRAGGVLGGGRLPPSLRSSGRHRPTALARSVACLTVRVANNHSNNGDCPHALASLTLRSACLNLSRDTSPRAPCSPNDKLCLPDPLAVTPPTIGAG